MQKRSEKKTPIAREPLFQAITQTLGAKSKLQKRETETDSELFNITYDHL